MSRAIVKMVIILLMISLAVHAQEEPESDSWENIPLEDLENMDAADLAENWEKLSETQRNDLYLKRMGEFQDQFSEQYGVELSRCEKNCRFEGGMIYNEPLKQGVPVSSLAGFSAEALPEPDGGFRIEGQGKLNLFGEAIDLGAHGYITVTEEAEFSKTPEGAPSFRTFVLMRVFVGANQQVTVNGIEYTGSQPFGGEIVLREENSRVSGSFAFHDPQTYTEGAAYDITFVAPKQIQPAGSSLDLNDLRINAGPFVIDPNDVEFRSGSLRIVTKYPSFEGGDINYEVNAYYPVGSNTANIRVESDAGNMNMFLRYTTGSGVIITTGYEERLKNTYIGITKKF